VTELRRRKLRVDKPFAVMMPDLAEIERHCFVSRAECELLESRQRPIVLLRHKPSSTIAPEIAPKQGTLGVMLPYTPLHYLLFAKETYIKALVMTSGNLSEEPIATDNDEARQRLSSLTDAFLMHNRDIRTRCDDSVVRVMDSKLARSESENTRDSSPASPYFLRRSRGYAPDSLQLPYQVPSILATGPELKNTFCLTREKYCFPQPSHR